MKGFAPLLLGIFGTFAFSWSGLVMIPNAQIGHLDPQTDEDGADPYPAPKSGMAELGRKVYMANGCVYCHSQQVRPDYVASDIDRKWGERRSAPRDYIFERPSLLGKMRMGPDLANMGKRAPSDDPAPATAAAAPTTTAPAAPGSSPPSATASPVAEASPAVAPSPAAATAAATADTGPPPAIPGAGPLPYSAAWHHRHLYSPRSLVPDSTMPAFRFLYEKRKVSGERAADAVNLTDPTGEATEDEIVPSYEAKCLVAYLMSLDQSHALKEVKSSAPASPPAPGKAAK